MDVVEKAQAAYKAKQDEKQSHQEKLLSAEAYDAIQQAVIKSGVAQIAHRKIHEPKVEVKNFPDIASPKDIKSLKEAVDKLAKELKPEKYDDQPIVDVLEEIRALVAAIPVEAPEMPEPVEEVTVKNQIDLKPLAEAIDKLDMKPVFDPKIEVKPSDVKAEVDLEPVIVAITALSDSIRAIEQKEAPEIDLSPVIEAAEATTHAISNLSFPVPNFVLPFKGADGKATQVQLDASGNLPVTSSGSSGWAAKATDAYGIQAISDDGTYKYFFFEDASANYYIMRKNKSTSVFDYTKGTGGYASVYVSSSAGPSGSPTYASYGTTF